MMFQLRRSPFLGALATFAAFACTEIDPAPDGPLGFAPSRLTAVSLNDTATVFPIRYGESANYTMTINDRGSIAAYRHRSRPTVAGGPNQPYLELPDDTFTTTGWKRFDLMEFSLPSALLFLEDQDELVFGPLETVTGLHVRRKIHIARDGDVVRSLEVVHNPTGAPISVRLRITSPTHGVLVVDDSGDDQLTGQDRYFATYASGAGTVAVLFDGPGRDRIDDIEDSLSETEFEWSAVTVPPGGTLIYAHFVWLNPDNDAGSARAAMEALLNLDCWEGLTASEASAVQNFTVEPCSNVRGSAGAAAPGQLLLTNNATGESTTATVAGDGSFEASLSAAVGNEIVLDHENGSSTLVEVVARDG